MSKKSRSLTATASFSLVLAALVAGCSDDDGNGTPKAPRDTARTEKSDQSEEKEVSARVMGPSSQVFPEVIAKSFEEEAVQPLASGGFAGVGRICGNMGADVFYVGVKDAVGLADDVYLVEMEPGGTTLRFQTGAPDSGVGAGAAQATFEEPEYTFTFAGLDVEITIAGCES